MHIKKHLENVHYKYIRTRKTVKIVQMCKILWQRLMKSLKLLEVEWYELTYITLNFQNKIDDDIYSVITLTLTNANIHRLTQWKIVQTRPYTVCILVFNKIMPHYMQMINIKFRSVFFLCFWTKDEGDTWDRYTW